VIVKVKGKEIVNGDTIVDLKRELKIESITAFANVTGGYPNRRIAVLSNNSLMVIDDERDYEKVTNDGPSQSQPKKTFDMGIKWSGGR